MAIIAYKYKVLFALETEEKNDLNFFIQNQK